ncbi:hypothetical protein [Chloroflexus sp.]|uniref:hypothetical protein n=1 Tax=Chloroflexus sp. TaxID=1904827 RepID=UPI002ACDB60F|nr:hypothetical protein [Chloroflexus sp.]
MTLFSTPAPLSGPHTQPGSLLRVVTHPKPDLDALAASWGLAYLLQMQAWLFFKAQPAPEDHDPAAGRFVVDVGGGPLDHHHTKPDGGSEADRSTCAFELVCRWCQAHPDPDVRYRADVLLRLVAPSVLRQDSTASLASPPDPVADLLGLPRLIDALHRRLGDDLAVAKAVKPWLDLVFDTALERDAAEARALAALPLVAQLRTPEILILTYRHREGELDLMRDVAWAQHPSAALLCYQTIHEDAAGHLLTISRGITRRRGLAALDVRAVIARLLELPISDELRAELRRWHAEPWFANRGGVKKPVIDEPPAGMLDELAAWLSHVLSAQS